MTGVQQVDEVVVRSWDPKTKEVIEASAKDEDGTSQIGVDALEGRKALGGGDVTVSDRPVSTPEEGDALAKSVLAQLGNAYFEAEGVDARQPAAARRRDGRDRRRRRALQRQLRARPRRAHVFRGTTGYQTHFTITGRSPRTLVDLIDARRRRDWFGTSLVVGVVTNNNDPTTWAACA